MNIKFLGVYAFFCLLLASSCSSTAQLTGKITTPLLQQEAIKQGHIGIAIYSISDSQYIYKYNSDKYFIPASNTKLFSTYAALACLGDSVPGISVVENDQSIIVTPMGDPTLLHPDFKDQPVVQYLRNQRKNIYYNSVRKFQTNRYGRGWSWDDYSESYMNERSELPVYGNNLSIYGNANKPAYFPAEAVKSMRITASESIKGNVKNATRQYYSNDFIVTEAATGYDTVLVPFITSDTLAFAILAAAVGKKISADTTAPIAFSNLSNSTIIYSQHLDSLLKPMMHSSDNFFAEQSLLMASDKELGIMDTRKIIDHLLKNKLSGLPQKPQWVDGSGLSRYNLFTPEDFVFLLLKMHAEQPWERIKEILPTGGEGTLRAYYRTIAGYIYAKTGTLSNNVALSGYLITKKNKTLVFSILVNNHMGGATPVRKAVEQFLLEIRENY